MKQNFRKSLSRDPVMDSNSKLKFIMTGGHANVPDGSTGLNYGRLLQTKKWQTTTDLTYPEPYLMRETFEFAGESGFRLTLVEVGF